MIEYRCRSGGGIFLEKSSRWPIILFVIIQLIAALILIIGMVGRLTLDTGAFIHFYPTFMILLLVYVVSLILAILTFFHPSKKVWATWIIRWCFAFIFAIAIIYSLNVWYISPDPMPSMYPWIRMGRPWEAVFEILMAIISLSFLVGLRSKFGYDD